MACGCPVVTTGEPPMTEVGGDVARYVPRLRPSDDLRAWANEGAQVLIELLSLQGADRERVDSDGLAWSARSVLRVDRCVSAHLSAHF